MQERRASDLAHDHERENSDAAITRERVRIKVAAEALFALERGATDADLLDERRNVDGEAEHLASDLTLALDAHKETRAILNGMSNDIQTPLSSISRLGAMLQASLVSEKVVSPEIYRLLGVIRRHSSTMERLVADLLDMESLNEGRLTLNLVKQDLADVLTECSQIFSIVAQAKKMQLTKNFGKDPLIGTFDRERILQVVSNLIQYALKGTLNNGVIAINARVDGSQLEVSVMNNGDAPAAELTAVFAVKSIQRYKNSREIRVDGDR